MSEYTSKKRKAIIIVFGSVNKFRSTNFLNIISYGAGVSRSNIAVQFVHRNALTRAPRHIKSVFTSTFINQVAITLFYENGNMGGPRQSVLENRQKISIIISILIKKDIAKKETRNLTKILPDTIKIGNACNLQWIFNNFS